MYSNENSDSSYADYSDFLLKVNSISKTFTLHNQGGVNINALNNFELELKKGECLVLSGPSGAGKSSVLKLLYGNYKLTSGEIKVLHKNEIIDLGSVEPLKIIDIRKHTMGYVSQFLDIIPRISALEAVCEPLLNMGINRDEAFGRAENMLEKLNLPKKLWSLPPSTFSGGEKQRVNIARGFIYDYPVMILDEPTASLDKDNVEVVCSLIGSSLEKGCGIIGIFHDESLKERLATRLICLGEN